MGQNRYAKRTDTNEKDIVKTLKGIPGVSVETDHHDILVGYRGLTRWYEIKNPDEISKTTGEPYPGRLTPAEQRRKDTWTGHYKIVSTAEEILEDLGVIHGL